MQKKPGHIQIRLRHYRTIHKYTQADMATRLGVTQQRYQQWESAGNDLRASTIAKICREFKINPSWLLGFSDVMELE